MLPRRTEVCVVGGGPAGSTVARRLAQLGHTVAVLERAAGPRPHVGESLPPSILPLLETLGVRGRIEGAGFLRPRGAVIRWAGAPRQRRGEGGEKGFQVDRARFDDLLLQAAEEAGAHVCRGVRARGARRRDGEWIVEVQHPRRRGQLSARYLVDATGRGGRVLPRRRRRVAAATLALFGYWRGSGPGGAETRIEAAEAAWFWGAPLPDGSFNATVFLDPRRLKNESLGPRSLYLRLLERSDLLASCRSGELLGPILACDATSHASVEPIFEGGLRVGESCFAIDPLSSQGVQAAMRSGLQAAAVAHTQLTVPTDAGLAEDFFRRRVKESVGRHRRMAGDFYAAELAAREAPSSFWRSRGEGFTGRRDAPELPTPPPGDARLRWHRETRVETTPVLEGDRIEGRPALAHPALERPLAFVADHGISDLVGDLEAVERAGEILGRWSRRAGPAAAGHLFRHLWRQRILIPAAPEFSPGQSETALLGGGSVRCARPE